MSLPESAFREMPGSPSRFASADEERRVATLNALALLDTEPEREFDALVALAAEMLDCPSAMMTLIDRDRLWIKAANDGERGEIARDLTMCNVTIQGSAPLVVEDLSGDSRFTANPLVAASNGVRFYAGAPIHAIADDGRRHPIGALCVLDTHPRSLNAAGRKALVHLATLAEAAIAARTAAMQALAIAVTADRQSSVLARQDRIFRQAERMAAIGSWRVLWPDGPLEWSDGVFRIHELPLGAQPDPSKAIDHYPPHAREQIAQALTDVISTGVPIDLELDFTTALGNSRRVRVQGELEHEAQRNVDGPVAIVGIFQDVTERHALELTLRRTAETDALTGLANRAAFDRALDAAIARARTAATPLLLALVDLDGFKAINDTLGHNAGDDVLRGVGQILQAPWLRGSLAARLGGDEFAVIVDDPALVGAPDEIVSRLQEALQVPVSVDGLAMISAGTVGIAALEPDCQTVRDFVHRVDIVLYRAKRERIGERRRAA